LVISLDDLAYADREEAYGRLLSFLELEDEPAMRDYFDHEVNAERANRERWREGLTTEEQDELQRFYERTLERLAQDGIHCAPELRRSYHRTDALAPSIGRSPTAGREAGPG
jgi:hypothetical protein